MDWNRWIRQIHRCVAVAFMLAFVINTVAVLLGKYTATVGYLAVAPLFVLLPTGLYMFVLPYAQKWRGERNSANGAAVAQRR